MPDFPENSRKLTLEIELDERYSDETIEQVKKFLAVVREGVVIFAAKQEAYGRQNIAKFGEKGVVIRSSDKNERLTNLLFNDRVEGTTDDSVEDAFFDQGNYGFIGVLCHRGTW